MAPLRIPVCSDTILCVQCELVNYVAQFCTAEALQHVCVQKGLVTPSNDTLGCNKCIMHHVI